MDCLHFYTKMKTFKAVKNFPILDGFVEAKALG